MATARLGYKPCRSTCNQLAAVDLLFPAAVMPRRSDATGKTLNGYSLASVRSIARLLLFNVVVCDVHSVLLYAHVTLVPSILASST